jgi:hypothetical protein
MNSCLTTEQQVRTICEQPGCLFKKPGFKSRQFAESLLQHLPKEFLLRIAPEFEQILARPQCIPCALNVLQGGKARLTSEEWDHLSELGRWHHRRQRRSRRWG